VLEAEAPKNEVQELPARAADRLAVVWGAPEAAAVGAAAVEVVEQGAKSGLFWLGPLRSNFCQKLCQFRGCQRLTQRSSSFFVQG
jgi:hypothetical protein